MNRKFLLELATLLEKHKASIMFGCGSGSDMHGVYDERMEVGFADDSCDVLSVGGCVDAEDLFKALSMNPAQWETHCKKMLE